MAQPNINQPVARIKTVQLPKWLDEWKKRTAIIQVIEQCFVENCDCTVCVTLRSIAKDMGDLFGAPQGVG